jgi:hypothetical protein
MNSSRILGRGWMIWASSLSSPSPSSMAERVGRWYVSFCGDR